MFIKGTLKEKTFYIVKFVGSIYLKGERIISSVNVRIPKCKVPILAETKKIIETEKIDRKSNIQDTGSKTLTIFHVGSASAGYLEK